MPPPVYNPVWLDEYGADTNASPRHQQMSAPEQDTPRVMVHQPGGGTFQRHTSLSEQSEVKQPLLTQSSVSSTSATLGGATSSNSSGAPAYQSTRDCRSYSEQTRPLLNRGTLVECRYQSTQDSGYEQSQDECNFPPPLDLDYRDPLTEEAFPSPLGPRYDPPPPEVAFETSLDYAYEQDLALGMIEDGAAAYRPSEDDGYAESCASSSQNAHTGDPKTCDHARNQCAYMNTSPFGEFMPVSAANSTTSGLTCNSGVGNASGQQHQQQLEGLPRNGSLHHSSNTGASPLQQMHNRYSSATLSPAHHNHHHPHLHRTASNSSTTSSPAPHTTHLNGTLPPPVYDPSRHDSQDLPPPPPQLQLQLQGHQTPGQGQGQGNQTRNIARLTLDGLELEIQVAPQNCYSGFAPETILRASKARQKHPAPKTCNVVNPEEVGEIILSDVSREVSISPEPSDFKGPARMCRTCCLRAAAFVAHIGFFVCVAILGVQIPLKKQYDVNLFILRHDENAQRELPKPYDEVALVTACVMLFLCYMVALGESYTADTETFVTNAMSREVLQSYMRELRDQVPIVGWDVICYHLETRQVTRTTRDRWGNETTTTSEEEVKVMTHRETLRFPFRIVKDISGDINLKGTAITKMEFHQMYGFLDMATAQKFTQIKEKLKERNRYRDEKMEFKEIFAMDNLKAHVTVFGEYGCLRQLMRPKIFCFFSCFLFSWPFRLLLKLTTKKKKYTVIKVLGL